MKSVILVDFLKSDRWEFSSKLNEFALFEVKGVQTNGKFYHSKVGTLIRYLIYFLYPLYFVLFHRKQYDMVIGWQQFYGINVAFWCRLFHLRKKNKLIVNTFIYKKRGGYIGYIYHRYIKWAVDNMYVDKIICYSSSEPEYYAQVLKMPVDKFCYIPLGLSRINDVEVTKGNYVFSTGRSNRDYGFLIESLKDADIPLTIACSGYHYNVEVPDTIKILQNCYGLAMRKQLAGCFCVVIPLADTHISSGQLVILQAMQLGKPVIVTENDTAEDYIHNGIDGYIIAKDAEKLLQIIQNLKVDDELYDKISAKAKETFEDRFSMSTLAVNTWNAIK